MAETTARQQHWDDRYATVGATNVSWYQDQPRMSAELLRRFGAGGSLVDVGGGASTLVDRLLADGWTDVTVLDVSATALAVARERVGESAGVTWLATDLLAWVPDRQYDVWHDRAVLHFLTEPDDVRRYRDTLCAAVPVGGLAVLGTFAADGPTTCSGLPVRRYAPEELVSALGAGFEPLATEREVHVTPSGAEQPFTWVVARVRG